ncbi:MAG: FAD-dependent monooxygenase [Phycisphaerales bacterium]|nr:FAD-dependent monooxygenase [Phycisphaerales bacterium]
MTDKDKPRFAIIGAGLGGALMANYLGKNGYHVDVYEMRPDPRKGEIVAGRSINLALSVRGMHGLSQVGLLDEVMKEAVAMPGRMMHAVSGELTYQPYGQKGQANYSVSRGGLNVILINAAEKLENVRVHFNHKCVDLDLDAPEAVFEERQSGETRRTQADIIIGADGTFSAVRRRMMRVDRFSHSMDYLDHGYKELCIPAADGGGFRIEKNALHIWPRRSFMMIALPNFDGSFTVTCFWPHDGPHGFSNLKTEQDVLAYFQKHFPDSISLMPTLARDFFENPTSSLATVRCRPWSYQGKVTLLGDAAHAVVPFYGQGMNASFEDCTELHECLQEFCPDWVKALDVYYDRRKENADAIADLALQNFIEMRDKVGDPAFLRKKKREKRLHRLFPNWFIPPYEMVSFTRIPYAETVRRASAQENALRNITAGIIAGTLLLLVILTWVLA